MWAANRGHRRGGLAQLLERLHEVDGRRMDSSTVSLSRDGRHRVDRGDGAPAEGVQVHGHAAAARASGSAARDAAPEQRRALSRDHRAISRSRARHHDALHLHRRLSRRDEAHVDYLEEWIGRAELDRVGFFEYSSEEDTPAPNSATRCRRANGAKRSSGCARRSAWLPNAPARAGSVRPWRVLVEERRTLRRTTSFAPRSAPRTCGSDARKAEAPGVDGGRLLYRRFRSPASSWR